MYKAIMAVIFILGSLSIQAGEPVPGIVVLANANMPESVELAEYYMSKRAIPADRLCLLDLPRGEVITREDFNQRVKEPLLKWLQDHDLIQPAAVDGGAKTVWHTKGIRYLVSIYGVPVSITSFTERFKNWIHGEMQHVDRAAVDSELCVLLLPVDTTGPLRNPFFAACGFDGESKQVLLCTRLDGADPAAVRSMIDGALEAERYGLNGYAWFDIRGLPRSSSYYAGDHMIEEAYERFKRAGYECYFDQKETLIGKDVPLDHAAVYMGWYEAHVTGPFRRKEFRFESGAVAYHLHSSSARRLRTSVGYWAGPLTALGASATMGAVAEPFLKYSPHLGIFSDRFCRGFTFAESAYMAQPVLSWQITVAGDPLYRPFAASIDEQIENIHRDGKTEQMQWLMLRKVNILLSEERYNQALSVCSQAAEELQSNILRERLADLYARNGMATEALALYEKICKTAASDFLVFRAGMKCTSLMRSIGRTEQAEITQSWLKERLKGHPGLQDALKE